MISIGIHTWNAPITLERSLTTYKESALLEVSDDIFVVSQNSESQAAEKEICDKFGIKFIALPDNGRMGSGYNAIYENAKHEYLMLLENDWTLNADRDSVDYFFANAIEFLKNGYDVVRARSRSNPGVPNGAAAWFSHHPPEIILQHGPNYLSESMFWINDPESVFPDHISKVDSVIPARNHGESWYTATSDYCNHTNQPCIYKKSFYRDAILPYCVFGKSIEDQIHNNWAKQQYKCVFGFGLFTHERHDGFWRTE
jgi:glycosyltransferase involved in cell wall biosynthesis